METILIGIGNRARQGKDWIAERLQQLTINNFQIHTLHFADALYEEVRNKERKYPLIKIEDYSSSSNHKFISILHDAKTGNYMTNRSDIVKSLYKEMQERNITEYWGMDEKDSRMLQVWGTDIRRMYFSDRYWVNKLHEKVYEIKSNNQNNIILIPDTRFKNEVSYIKDNGGYYISVWRLNPNNSRYIAPDRDPDHPSEKELDAFQADYYLIAKSGDTETLQRDAVKILMDILNKEALK